MTRRVCHWREGAEEMREAVNPAKRSRMNLNGDWRDKDGIVNGKENELIRNECFRENMGKFKVVKRLTGKKKHTVE